MGWLRLGACSNNKGIPSVSGGSTYDNIKVDVEYIESVPNQLAAKPTKLYPYISTSILDSGLPYIPATEVKNSKSEQEGSIWIVVDNIVYDCTEFIHEHPGGEGIIKGFGGAECSWQFWRFHGKREMEEFGKPLRIGRTEGLVNKYKEPVKYVGLMRIGFDEW